MARMLNWSTAAEHMRTCLRRKPSITGNAPTAQPARWIVPGHTRPEDRLLFACARQTFLEAHLAAVLDTCSTAEVNWADVYATALLHGVAPLVYANVLRCKTLKHRIPPDIVDQFEQCLAWNMFVKERTTQRITTALAFFHNRSIEVMLIKGAALDVLVYEQPWYITSADVDVIVRPSKDELPDTDVAEIWAFIRDLGGIECGYFGHHDVDMNGVLPINFHRIWADATSIKLRGQAAYVMSPEDMLISVCINSCRKRFFRLKALCDIAEIMNKYSDMEWEVVARKAREYDCHHIVYTALLVTHMTVGCELPQGLLASLMVNPARALLIRYLSQRASLSSLYAGRKMFSRQVNLSLILPYASYRWYQVWRNTWAVYRTKEGPSHG